MADDVADVTTNAAVWMTYRQAGDRLGLSPEAVAARARRRHWPKRKNPARNDDLVEVLVPAEDLAQALSAARKRPPDASPTRKPEHTTDVAGDAVRAAVAPLQAIVNAQAGELQEVRAALETARTELAEAKAEAAAAQARADTLASEAQNLRAQIDREVADRRTLQGQADALRDQLASAQIDAAQATGAANTERAKREAAELALRDAQQRLADAERRAERRPWWRRLV